MTLEEAKQKVAEKYSFKTWKELQSFYKSTNVREQLMERVAETYARGKCKQTWVMVKSYPNYEISNFGHVRNNSQYLTQHRNSSGYLRVNLYKNSIGKKVFIHHLVAEHFIGERPIGMVVMHIDNNRLNNHESNLKYGTQSENLIQSINEGRKPSLSNKNKTPQLVIDSIIALRKSGMKLLDIEKSSGVPMSTIQKIFTRNKIYAPKPEFKP